MKSRVVIISILLYFLVVSNAVAINFGEWHPMFQFRTMLFNESSVMILFGAGLIVLANVGRNKGE